MGADTFSLVYTFPRRTGIGLQEHDKAKTEPDPSVEGPTSQPKDVTREREKLQRAPDDDKIPDTKRSDRKSVPRGWGLSAPRVSRRCFSIPLTGWTSDPVTSDSGSRILIRDPCKNLD